jgi:hypothetical protein
MTRHKAAAIAAELRGELAVHDQVAAAHLKSAARHLRRSTAIERELQRLEKPRKRTDSQLRVA